MQVTVIGACNAIRFWRVERAEFPAGMVHEVAAHQVILVTQAIGCGRVGDEQQPCVLYAATGQDILLGVHGTRTTFQRANARLVHGGAACGRIQFQQVGIQQDSDVGGLLKVCPVGVSKHDRAVGEGLVDHFMGCLLYTSSVKPGLTGWAQLRYPYGASVHDAEEKLKFDLFYVKNQGLTFDLMILLQTVEVVLFGRGARRSWQA